MSECLPKKKDIIDILGKVIKETNSEIHFNM